MQQFVTVRQLVGKKLLGVARRHVVITDRPVQDGGGDLGCTSGELLRLAIGSCVASRVGQGSEVELRIVHSEKSD